MEPGPWAREQALAFLRGEPIRYAHLLGRLLDEGGEVRVAGEPVEGVLVVGPPREGKPRRLGLATRSPSAARELLASLPPGDYSLAFTDADLVPALASSFEIGERWDAWLLHLEPGSFTPQGDLPYRPVPPDYAERIATAWDPEGVPEATGYIRSRLERGPSVGLWLDGDLVGWYGTHAVTYRVALLGFLHVLGPYRGKGWGKALASSLARHVLASGRIPACHVEVGNGPSLVLHRAVGFREHCLQAWVRLTVPGGSPGEPRGAATS